MPANNPFFDHYLHLRPLPDATLRDLGRNEAAPRDYRKFAVELLLHRRSPYAKHSDLQQFVAELETEMDGIQTEFPAPEPVDPGPGPLTCSVTTKTMFGQDVVDNVPSGDEFTGFDSIQIMDEKKDTDAA